jgi:hypothetical protein
LVERQTSGVSVFVNFSGGERISPRTNRVYAVTVATEQEVKALIASHGGAFDPSSLAAPFEALLLDLSGWGRTLVDGLRQHMKSQWSKRPLEIIFLNSRDLNAWATKSHNADYVLITIGLVEKIYGTMAGMMSAPSFLRAIGTAPADEPPQSELAHGFPSMPLLRKELGTDAIQLCWPTDELRVAFAMQLASMALQFTLLHEIGHIFGGHLERCEQRGITPNIREFGAGGHEECLIPDQILECDADTFAAHAQSFVDLHPESDGLWGETYQWNDVPGADAGFIAHAIAMSVLFRLFDMLEGDGHAPTGDRPATHPHPAVRSNMAISRSFSLAMSAGRFAISDLPRLIEASLIPVEQVWTRLGLPGQRLGPRASWATQIAKLSGELGRLYELMMPPLRDLARVPPRWHAPWPQFD